MRYHNDELSTIWLPIRRRRVRWADGGRWVSRFPPGLRWGQKRRDTAVRRSLRKQIRHGDVWGSRGRAPRKKRTHARRWARRVGGGPRIPGALRGETLGRSRPKIRGRRGLNRGSNTPPKSAADAADFSLRRTPWRSIKKPTRYAAWQRRRKGRC